MVRNSEFSPPISFAMLGLLGLVTTLSAGCDKEPLATGMLSHFEPNCSFCHGNKDNAAPPTALDPSRELGVGAHQAHLKVGTVAAAVECEECHTVPEDPADPDHLPEEGEAPEAEVVFGSLATTANLAPEWIRSEAKCANTYCHGGSLSGGRHAEPIWTQTDQTQIECDSCHGAPPPLPHPQEPLAEDCASCHPDTVDNNGNILVAGGLHINGKTEAATECYSCHGREGINDAPPFSISGSEDTSEIGVGAHQSHLVDGKNSKALECEACHVVPEEDDDPDHLPDGPEDLTAEVVFGEFAATKNLRPAWLRDTTTCRDVYCHGTSLAGGRHTAPNWTIVDDSQKECDSCHGNPPPAPHPQNPVAERCGSCHPDTVDAVGEILIARGKHINGELESKTECYSCHGRKDVNNAPPVSLEGSSDTSTIGVGAHQAHLQAGNVANGFACETCHIVPEELGDVDHLSIDENDDAAEVVFGELAKTGDLQPEWNRDTGACANTYCHGSALRQPGQHATPIWTKVDGTQSSCDGCHGNPPTDRHVPREDCWTCHGETVANDGNILLLEGRHINGVTDARVDCNDCHGTGPLGAPPPSLSGVSSSSDIGVGAHLTHLSGGNFRGAMECTECHIVPPDEKALTHLDGDGQAEVVFGKLATAQSSTPIWNRTLPSPTCRGVYCHGAAQGDGTRDEPIWNRTDGSQVFCGSCHAIPPTLPQHPDRWDCEFCHPRTIIQNLTLDLSSGTHIDGSLTFF